MNVLLDTCVVSELNLRKPNPRVVAAVDHLGQDNLFVAAITMGEIQKGITMLPAGRRRTGFEEWLGSVIAMYDHRILDIDVNTALIWGELSARPQFRGRTTLSVDLLIAATALNHGLRVMTRNTRDFADTGVLLVDPWHEGD